VGKCEEGAEVVQKTKKNESKNSLYGNLQGGIGVLDEPLEVSYDKVITSTQQEQGRPATCLSSPKHGGKI